MILLPSGYLSHIPGGLDPVTSAAQDLEIVPGPLVTSHGDWPDVVENVVMRGGGIPVCIGFVDYLPAPGTLPSLLIPHKPSHFSDRGPLFIPVLQGAGSLAARGVLVSRSEVYSLATAMGTGTTADPLLLFRSIMSIFPYYHIQVPPSWSGLLLLCAFCSRPDKTGEDGVKVFRDNVI
jgi:hypothetical protein